MCVKWTSRTSMGVRWFPRTVVVLLILIYVSSMFRGSSNGPDLVGHTALLVDANNQVFSYSSQTHPFIFIGGHPRSGTTLMRAMLDAHSYVRCGEETRIVPRMLQMRENWVKSANEMNRLLQGGINKKVIDAATSSFILETIVNHGEPAKVLCNKDPLTLKQGSYLSDIFPKAKFLFMMRDGRAVVHSVVTRKVTITGYDLESPRQCLEKWNSAVSMMDEQCRAIGSKRCLVVYYEQLVLHPKKWMEIILNFLELPWDENVLHHEELINKPGGIAVSNRERSSDQIIKPINLEALTKWVSFYQEDVIAEMGELAPMLQRFGYDPNEVPPRYGLPDFEVINQTNLVRKDRDFWEARGKQLLDEMEKTDETI